MSGRINGDLPRWAVRALVWMLASVLSAVVLWARELPALPGRVAALERVHDDLRREIQAGFRDLTQRMDRLLERQRH